MMTTNRKPRATEDRATSDERPTSWKPPELLPTPEPRDGYEYRWVRSAMLGQLDNVNVSSKFREGWEPVPASEVPELKILNDHGSRFPDNIEVGGLILCKCPAEIMRQRREHQTQKAMGQIEAVDRNYLREGDPRMPLLKPERRSRTSRFGDG